MSIFIFFSIAFANIYLFSAFFSIDFARGNMWDYPTLFKSWFINFKFREKRSSLIYNTSARHERQECDISETSATWARRVRHKCDTSATRTTRERHECYKNDTRATRVKNLANHILLILCIFIKPNVWYSWSLKILAIKRWFPFNFAKILQGRHFLVGGPKIQTFTRHFFWELPSKYCIVEITAIFVCFLLNWFRRYSMKWSSNFDGP